jgi:alpha-tubulin suppressor-like RCC1 family protein
LGLSFSTNIFIPTKIMIQNVKQISTGEAFSIVLTQNNNLYSFGENTYGQLGLGHNMNIFSPNLIQNFTNNNILQISCGISQNVIMFYNTIKMFVLGRDIV